MREWSDEQMNPIREVAELLIYKGPSIEELIDAARQVGHEVDLKMECGMAKLIIQSKAAYDLRIQDIYIFDSDGHLIKQLLKMNDKVKTIFDKYKEANQILEKIDVPLAAC